MMIVNLDNPQSWESKSAHCSSLVQKSSNAEPTFCINTKRAPKTEPNSPEGPESVELQTVRPYFVSKRKNKRNTIEYAMVII